VLEEKEGQDPSPGVVAQVLSKEEEEGFSQDDIMLGSCEPAHREPSLHWTKITGKNLNVASSCKVEYIVIVISHFERFNYWRVAGINTCRVMLSSRMEMV